MPVLLDLRILYVLKVADVYNITEFSEENNSLYVFLIAVC